MQGRFVLAIDQGTTGTTVLVFDRSGRLRGRAYSEFTQHFPRPGWVEHDPEEIWSVSHRVMERALRAARARPADVTAIGITNQRETTVLWDRRTGRPVSRAIVWQDRRTADLCDRLRADGWSGAVRRRTGLELDPYFSGTKVRWLLDHVPGLRRRAARGEIAFGTVDAWLVWKLTGGRVHATDYSNASRTMLYNIRTLRWDDELLAGLKVPPEVLPDVRASSGEFGETDPRAFFGARVPVAGVAGDQQSALFGQACYGRGRAKNTYGTGSFLLLNTGERPVASRHRLLTTIAWRIGAAPVEYALEGAIFITGAAVQWLRDGLGIVARASETEAMARSLRSNEGVYFVPALTGLGAPHWDARARGTIVGLTRGSTRAHLVRAALEAMCFQTCDVVRAMERDAGFRLRELRADGGATANGFVMQMQADLLNVPVDVPVISETTALGAAYLAGLGVGFWKSRAEIDAHWRRARRYEPQMKSAERERLLSAWADAVRRARSK